MTGLVDRYLLQLAMLASAGALGIALIAQYGFGLEPCILCSYQRIPYGGVVALGVFALLVGRWDRHSVAVLLGVVFLGSAALAFYHNGVEQHWWEAATACGSGGGELPASLSALSQSLTQGAMPKACDEIDWTLFGLSITVYNTVFSLALSAGCFWSAKKSHGQTA